MWQYLARCPEKEEVFTSAFYLCEPILIFSWIKLSNSAGSNLAHIQQNANNYSRVPVKYSIDDSWIVTETANACCQVFCALEAAKPIYQFPFISNQAAQLVTVPSWIVSIFILAALSIYFCMNSSGGENITKSSKTLTFPMIVRASVAECLVRFASVLQISRWKLRHPTEAVLGTVLVYGVLALNLTETLYVTCNLGVWGPFFFGRIWNHTVWAVLWLEIGPEKNGP